jgi:hypothetical protein
MRSRIPFAGVLLCLAIGWGHASASAATPPAADPRATSSLEMRLTPSATCPGDAVDELSKTIEFVRGQTWADQPGSNSLTIAPDLNACRVVLHVGQLNDQEEAALKTGAGSRLAIEYRRDWAKPSRLLLILWVVFGGSGLIWVYVRYARR